MFTSDLDRLIPEERIERIEAFEKQIKEGKYNPLPECEKTVRYRAKNEYRQIISMGMPISFIGAIVIGSTLAVPSFFVGVMGAGGLIGSMVIARLRLNSKLRDVKTGNWGEHLTDDELEKLDDYQRKINPSTEEAKYAKELIKKICDDLLEDDDEEDDGNGKKDEAVEVKAEEVEENEPEVREKPSLETEQFVKPAVWLDSPAPKPTTDSFGGPINSPTVDDAQLERLNRLEEKETDDFVELKKGQAEAKARQEAFEKTMLVALEAIGNRNAETPKMRSVPETAETIGIQGLSASETTPETKKDFVSETSIHPEKSMIIVGDFDPEKKERPDEFATYHMLVSIENYKPAGVPIVERMWKAQPGASKRYKAAVVRRDQFAARLEDFGDFKLNGEGN